MHAQMEEVQEALQQKEEALQTAAARAVEELDRGMEAVWQINEEKERELEDIRREKEGLLQRVAHLEEALGGLFTSDVQHIAFQGRARDG